MYRTLQQNKRLHALIGMLNIDTETKQDLVYSYSGGREVSSAGLLYPECQALINCLQARSNGATWSESTPENKMRRKILSMCHEMRWKDEITDNIDWKRLNGWLKDYGYLHKKFNKYTEQELPKLVYQFEQLLKSYYDKR